MAITVEARTDFVRGLILISIWFARKLARERSIDVGEALTKYTNLYRLTILADGQNHPARGYVDPQWEEVLNDLRALYAAHAMDDDTTALENDALEKVWPLAHPRIEMDAWPKYVSDRPFGFFAYFEDDKALPEGRLPLHLANPFAPRSPFDDMRGRANDLLRAVQDARSKWPQLQTVSVGSWLCSFEPFLSLFPPEFARSRSAPTEIVYTLGWWGQLQDRTGGFHRRNAEHLRRTGSFPFPCVTCSCPIDSAENHAREMLQRW